jgi:L-alanine-DL-glutamate epimerase-like enolase superfamily enzyme
VKSVPLSIDAHTQSWPLDKPFRTSRGASNEACVVVVTVTDGQHTGRGEATPITRYKQTPASVLAQIESIKNEKNLDRQKLQRLLPAASARNALDCAFWDLQAKISGKRVWELANIPVVPKITTAFTISLDTPETMRGSAAAFVRQTKEGRSPDRPQRLGTRRSSSRPGATGILKLKLGGDNLDLERVKAVRDAASRARLFIDANESWSPEHYRKIVPELAGLGIELIEQPFPADSDDVLESLEHPIPVCADESCHTTEDLARLTSRYEAINIKLDKTGGLTEAVRLMQLAREKKFKILIGCMVCTSLGIAPARLLASTADFVDLDGPLLLAGDRHHGLGYEDDRIGLPTRELWG